MNPTALAVLLLALTQSQPDVAVTPNMKNIGVATNALAVDLWGKLAAADGNRSCSPASIGMALAMTAAGAGGATQQELLAFLHADVALLPAFGMLGRRLVTEGKVKMAIANRLFGDKGCPFEKEYLALLASGFGAPLESLDIRGDPEKTRLYVNDWVAAQTAQKIKDILPPQSVDQDTRLLLANAVYFLGDWAQPFEANRTKPQSFHLADGTAPEVPTMDQTTSLEFAEVAGHQVVQLLYKDKDFGMLFILPPKDAAPVSWLGKAVLELPAKLSSERVHLLLPKFRVEAPATTELKKTMQALGVHAAFDRVRADLTGIANPPDPRDRLFIGEVYHKAFVRVDEKGTEAAAATVVSMARGAAAPPKPPREVRFDRPFAFVLRHLPSGAALFVGKVMDPR